MPEFWEDDGAPTYRPTPEPVTMPAGELDDEPEESNLAAAAAVVSLRGLVVRRAGWWLAAMLVPVARWVGQAAATAARREAIARHAVTVASYERKLSAERMKSYKWKTKCEALTAEVESMTQLHVRIVARVKAETVAIRAGEAMITQRAGQ